MAGIYIASVELQVSAPESKGYPSKGGAAQKKKGHNGTRGLLTNNVRLGEKN